MTREKEQQILKEMAETIGAASKLFTAMPLTGFLGMEGEKYCGELMLVGKAVNGWTEKGWSPAELSQSDKLDEFVNAVFKSVTQTSQRGGPCPLRWVTDYWGNAKNEGYNSRSSAFWRAARRTVLGLKIPSLDQNTWPSHLVWSNLYKIAPKAGGNPGKLLQGLQRDKCRELLMHEVTTFRPKRLLFTTGMSWAAPFLDSSCLVHRDELPTGHYVQGIGDIIADGETLGRFVVAVHPQGKNEIGWTEEVLNSFVP